VRLYVLWRHQHDEFELLGVFSTPEKFKQFVEQKYPSVPNWVSVASRERGMVFSTPQWEFIASPMEVDKPAE
jgi:hypothetical protein